VKFSNDAQYCVSGGQDKAVIIWNPFKPKLVKGYKGIHNHEVLDFQITNDNNRIASCGGDRSIFYWDVQTGGVIKSFSGHNSRVNAVAFNKEENLIISGSYDGTMRFWDLKQRKSVELECCKHFNDSVTSVIIHESLVFASCVDGRMRTFDIRMGEVTSGKKILA
jgi:mitogen-activated protein kinase organizer 1